MTQWIEDRARRDAAAGVLQEITHVALQSGRGAEDEIGQPATRQPLRMRFRDNGYEQVADIRFVVPECTPTWLGLWTAERGGRLRAALQLENPEAYALGDTCLVPAGSIVIEVRSGDGA